MRRALLLVVFGLALVGAASGALCDATPIQPDTAKLDPAAMPASARPSEPGRPYTSVIVDAGGLKLDRSMSPKIRRVSGAEVWGTVSVSIEFVEDHGIVAYTKTLDEAMKNPRCGLNPVVIKALDRAGGKFLCDPVICDADASLLLAENAKGKFLDKFNVIFVKDGRL